MNLAFPLQDNLCHVSNKFKKNQKISDNRQSLLFSGRVRRRNWGFGDRLSVCMCTLPTDWTIVPTPSMRTIQEPAVVEVQQSTIRLVCSWFNCGNRIGFPHSEPSVSNCLVVSWILIIFRTDFSHLNRLTLWNEAHQICYFEREERTTNYLTSWPCSVEESVRVSPHLCRNDVRSVRRVLAGPTHRMNDVMWSPWLDLRPAYTPHKTTNHQHTLLLIGFNSLHCLKYFHYGWIFDGLSSKHISSHFRPGMVNGWMRRSSYAWNYYYSESGPVWSMKTG